MKKLRLLLLDANIVIKLLEEGIWGDVVSQCEVLVARSVFGEVQFIWDEEGFAETVSLKEDEATGRIKVFEVESKKLVNFKRLFVDTVVERIDPGELESLVFLFSQSEEYRLASADGIVFRILGGCARADNGISLEEILDQIGLGRSIEKQFCKEFRDNLTARGFAEQMQDRLMRAGCTTADCVAVARSVTL